MRQFILDVTPDGAAGLATLRLSDAHERQLGFHQVRFADHPASRWEGLFDTGGYVGRYAGNLVPAGRAEPYTEQELLTELGVFLARALLGEQIMQGLGGSAQRTLLVRLPRAEDPLTAGLARVPWEIARATAADRSLSERNLVVRLLLAGTTPETGTTPLELDPGEELRILLVFAEAPGSRPLAMRQEHERLLELFRKEIQPAKRVRVDVLCHGVTREALRQQVADARGYHVLHWSGHGHRNLLELRGPDGDSETLSGEALVELLEEAGGLYPRLVFLSACHTGALTQARDWAELKAALGLSEAGPTDATQRQNLPAPADAPQDLSAAVAKDSGYAGTALALLRSGVPQVVAMRYAVGDDYARRLARRFYRELLGPAGQPADTALNQARKELLRHREAARMAAADNANPMVLGAERVSLTPDRGRSPQLNRIAPRPQPLLSNDRRDLEPRAHFVGRGAQLSLLNLQWLQAEERSLALVQGLGGLGKTALAAEAIHLWHPRFDWVLCWQSRPDELTADAFYRDLDLRLTQHSQKVYAETCRGWPAGRVYLEPGARWSGAARYDQMRANLLQALTAEAILLVLDNFETNLAEHPTAQGHPCRDPEWERLLPALAEGLAGTRSRLLVTSRHRPAALFGNRTRDQVQWLPLGPLSVGEALLFLNQCEALAALLHGGGADTALAQRVLDVSRGHPLILERLCALAPERPALTQALDTLAAEGGYGRLPDLFARGRSAQEQEREHRYLEDVAVGSVDLLLRRQTPEARRLLWTLALASEPVDEAMLAGVWSGKSTEDEAADQLRALLAIRDQLPEQLRAQLENLPPELLATLQAAPRSKPVPPPEPLLRSLHEAGLIHREADEGPWTCLELVRERALAWMATSPQETNGRTPEQVRIAYAERCEALFNQLLQSGAENARDGAVLAGRRALGYCVRAGALDRLVNFASRLVINTRDPRLLDGVVRELQSVAEQVPQGRDHWYLRATIADGLARAGRPDESLPFYEPAAVEAEAAGQWRDLAWITQNWANALRDAGQLDAAKDRYRASVAAKRKAGRPEIDILGSELEALRTEVMQGEAERVRPEIEEGLERIRGWWRRSRAGERVPEAPDPESLGLFMTGALDVAQQAAFALKDWEGTLALLDELETVDKALGTGEHQRARTRANRYGPLLKLDRLGEAKVLLEGCLTIFRRFDAVADQAKALGALADLWDERGDPGQAADLQRRALDLSNRLPDPGARAVSHNNLANYVGRQGEIRTSARHRLAALCYAAVSGYGDLLGRHVRNLAIAMADARDKGEDYPLPSLETLLAEPELDPLRRFLAERGIPVPDLQQAIDALVQEIA